MQWSLFYTSTTVFYWKNKYSKVQNGTSTGRLRDPVAGLLGDQMTGLFGGVRGTSVIHVLQIQLRNILNLL